MPKRQRFNSGLQDSRRTIRSLRQLTPEGVLSTSELKPNTLTPEDMWSIMKKEAEKPNTLTPEDIFQDPNLIRELMGSGKKSRRKKKVK